MDPSKDQIGTGGITPTVRTETRNGDVFTSDRGTLRRTFTPDGIRIEYDRLSLADYAEILGDVFHTSVIDRTGLSGVYQLFVDYPPNSQDTPSNRDIVDTVRESVQALGLNMERVKGPLDHIVVENINRTPSDN